MAKSKKGSSSLGVVVFMVVAVIFAALAGLLISRLLSQSYASEPVRPILVAARDLQSGTPLEKTDLRLAQWPVSSIPRGAFSSINKLLASEAVPLTPLVAGEPVLASHLSKPQSGMGVAAKLKPSQRAVAIMSESSVTYARLVYPGARVDVLTTLRRPGPGFRGVKTKVILQNVLVLAVGPDIDPLTIVQRNKPATGLKKIDLLQGRARPPQAARRVVTLAVTPEQAERMVLAGREGKVDLILRSPSDEATVETPGTTAASILGEEEAPSESLSPISAFEHREPAPPPPPKKRARRRPKRLVSKKPSKKEAEPKRPSGPEIYRVR